MVCRELSVTTTNRVEDVYPKTTPRIPVLSCVYVAIIPSKTTYFTNYITNVHWLPACLLRASKVTQHRSGVDVLEIAAPFSELGQDRGFQRERDRVLLQEHGPHRGILQKVDQDLGRRTPPVIPSGYHQALLYALYRHSFR